MAHDIFISHSSEDRAIAHAVCHHMEAAGLRCWIAPRDIAPGDGWDEAIIKAVSTSRILVLIFSAAANSSRAVNNEIVAAADGNVIIFPFRIEDVAPSGGLRFHLQRLHWLDALTPPVEEHIDRLVAAARRVLTPGEGYADVDEPAPDLSPRAARTALTRASHRRLPYVDDLMEILARPRTFIDAAVHAPESASLLPAFLFMVVSELLVVIVSIPAIGRGMLSAEGWAIGVFFGIVDTVGYVFALKAAWTIVRRPIALRACTIFVLYAMSIAELLSSLATAFVYSGIKLVAKDLYDGMNRAMFGDPAYLMPVIRKMAGLSLLPGLLVAFLAVVLVAGCVLSIWYFLRPWRVLRVMAGASKGRSVSAFSVFLVLSLLLLAFVGVIGESTAAPG